jgi:hypothetical protein
MFIRLIFSIILVCVPVSFCFAAIELDELESILKPYGDKIAALEARILELESADSERILSSQVERLEQTTENLVLSAQRLQNQSSSRINAFNPAISAVLTGSYSKQRRDPDAFTIEGFRLGEGAGPPGRGLALGETEVTLSGSVDDKFRGQATVAFALGDEVEVELEEFFIESLSLPYGLTAKAGRFFSGIGYLNEKHTHTDSFIERPLVYQTIFGGVQLGDEGLQLRWLAPTDTFLEFGAEILRGASAPINGSARHGKGTKTLFAHIGGDVGNYGSWQWGLSALAGKSRETNIREGDFTFVGDLDLWGSDLVYKVAPTGNPGANLWTFQAEYYRGKEDGFIIDDLGIQTLQEGQFDGYYAQILHRFSPSYQLGYRYDRVTPNEKGLLGTRFNPTRHSVMLELTNSEFGEFRLQFSRDKLQSGVALNQLTLQYLMAFGAHGAHIF